MRRIRRILVAVKDSAGNAPPALGKAAQLARALAAELVLFQAIDTPLSLEDHLARGRGVTDIERGKREPCLARLERQARRLRRLGIRVKVSAEWDYPAYEAIVRAAGRVGADLIVAERHPGRHVAASFLHLTDWELLRLAPLPVLLVKRRGLYRRPRVLAAVDPDRRYAKPVQLDREILEASAPETRSAVVVMGALARSGLRGFLIGNTAERVLDQLPCDLLVVKPRGFRRELPRRRRGARHLSLPMT